MAARAQHPENGESALLLKLEGVTRLSDEDRDALAGMCEGARAFEARRNIIREGDRTENVHLMVEGWAARYKLLEDGRRQITAFLLPGDFCDLHVDILGEMDHSIATLTRARVAFLSRERMAALTDRPRIAKAFWWATLVDEGVLRSWIVNVGRRNAEQAIGHLICELHVRMRNVGLAEGGTFDLPLTQEELADALGLTPVHVNRVLQRMRADGLIAFKGGTMTILDSARLAEESGFNPNYLHLQERR